MEQSRHRPGIKANQTFRGYFQKGLSAGCFTMVMLAIIISGCSREAAHTPENKMDNAEGEIRAASAHAGNKKVSFPANDPGAPLYVRMSPP